MQQNRKISFNWAATIALVIATFAITLFTVAYKLPQVYKYENDVVGNKVEEADTEFLKNSTISSEDSAPYLETGLDNIFYTADSLGKINFYKFSDGTYEKVKATKTVKFALPGTDDGKNVEISFVTDGNNTMGFGVYSKKDSTTYPYAFIKVIQNTITDNYDYIAFIDNDIADYYKSDKTYNYAYAFSAKKSDVQEIFALDNETSFIPVDLIVEKHDGFYYFMSNGSDYSYTLYYKNTISGYAVVYAENIALPYAFCKDNQLLLLETIDGALCLRAVGNFDEVNVKVFSGSPSQYLVKDEYILDTESKTLYDVLGATEQVMNSQISITNLEDFAVSSGGSKIAIAGSLGSTSKLFLYEFATGNLKTIDGNGIFLSGNPNLIFSGNYLLFLSPATKSDKVVNIAIPWDSIM